MIIAFQIDTANLTPKDAAILAGFSSHMPATKIKLDKRDVDANKAETKEEEDKLKIPQESDAEVPAPAVEEPALAKPSPKATKAKTEEVTEDELRRLCMAHAVKHGRAATDAVLMKIGGAKKLNLINASKYVTLASALLK